MGERASDGGTKEVLVGALKKFQITGFVLHYIAEDVSLPAFNL